MRLPRRALVQAIGFYPKGVTRESPTNEVGSPLVYGGSGHVELRTKNGFASDYHSKNACFYPLVAIYAKFSS